MEDCRLEDNVSPKSETSRGPVILKPLLPRGMCPAELEDKLAIYGANTKQLVSFVCVNYFL